MGIKKGEGFVAQASSLVGILSKSYNVEIYPYTTAEDFISSWNSMSGNYEAIFIIGHGTAGKLNFKGSVSIAAKGGDYAFSSLKAVNANNLLLYCCNGATLDSYNNSTAQNFANLTDAPVGAVQNGKLNIGMPGCIPKPVMGGTWVIIYPD